MREKAEGVDGTSKEFEYVNFDNAEHIKESEILAIIKRASNICSLSVVNAKGNGKRIRFSGALHDALGNPISVQVVKDGNRLVVGERLPGAEKTYRFSPDEVTNIIYSAVLVFWLTEKFGLDYSDRTSRTFTDIKIVSPADGTSSYAIVDMTK